MVSSPIVVILHLYAAADLPTGLSWVYVHIICALYVSKLMYAPFSSLLPIYVHFDPCLRIATGPYRLE